MNWGQMGAVTETNCRCVSDTAVVVLQRMFTYAGATYNGTS